MGVIAPFPKLTSLDGGMHKGFSLAVYMRREINWLWQYSLVTTSLLMDLHPARWHRSLGCTARQCFAQVFDFTSEYLC